MPKKSKKVSKSEAERRHPRLRHALGHVVHVAVAGEAHGPGALQRVVDGLVAVVAVLGLRLRHQDDWKLKGRTRLRLERLTSVGKLFPDCAASPLVVNLATVL